MCLLPKSCSQPKELPKPTVIQSCPRAIAV